MAEAKTREQLETDWWAAWWRADYSWEGLEDKLVGVKRRELPEPAELLGPWEPAKAAKLVEWVEQMKLAAEAPPGAHGGLHGDMTLQDYWRRDPATGAVRDDAAMRAAGELVDCGGTEFHIAHLPPKTKSGASTWKAGLKDWNWGRLEELLARRIGAGAETKVNSFGAAEGPDGRAQFAGAVLRGALSHPPGDESALHLDARRTATLGRADYNRHRFGPGADFRSAIFTGGAGFNGVTFSGGAGFTGATFSGGAGFSGATFSGDADFDGATFTGGAGFFGATFSGDADFDGATFTGGAGFFGVTFSGDAGFTGVTFSGGAGFKDVTFSGDADFDGVTFSGDADFDGVTFSGDAGFFGVTFSGDADFDDVTFSGDADFDQSKFVGTLRFKAKVEGAAKFEGGRCEGRVWFDNSEFAGKFRVAFREFLGRTYLDGVEFRGPMEFQVATFDKFVSFEKIKWPKAARDWHGAFTGAQFRSPVSFEDAGFQALAAFDGAIVESRIWIDAVGEAAAKEKFALEFDAATQPDASDGADFEKKENEKRKEKDGDAALPVTRKEIDKYVKHTAPEDRLKQLEGGCRVLKQAIGGASDKSREQMFYRFELLARRQRRGLRFDEWFFSHLYGRASRYGASIWLPVLWLAVLIGLFGGGFFFWAYALGLVGAGDRRIDVITAAWQAFDLSWANVFKPLFALSADAQAEGTLGDRLLGATPWVAFAVRAAATIQSLLAIVLAFLFALAVRRRFQIN